MRVERPRRAAEQAIEIQPVELAIGLLDQLEEVHGVGDRHHLTRRAHHADVEAADVPWEVVVGRVTVQSLPRAVGRIVVTEALGRPSAAHHQRAAVSTHAALHLERRAVPEALGIFRRLAA